MTGHVAVLGAGSWGTAFAKILADAGRDVTIWARPQPVAEAIRSRRPNPEYLPVIHLHPLDRLRLQRGAEHLHTLGPRATAELLAEVGARIGGMPAIITVLRELEARPRPPRRRRAEVVR